MIRNYSQAVLSKVVFAAALLFTCSTVWASNTVQISSYFDNDTVSGAPSFEYLLLIDNRDRKVRLLDKSFNAHNTWDFPNNIGSKSLAMSAQLTKNGNLVLLTHENNITTLSWDGEQLSEINIPAHHHFDIGTDGNIFTLLTEDDFDDKWDLELLRSDYIVEIDANGKTVWTWHAKDHLEEIIQLFSLPEPFTRPYWSYINSISVIKETHPTNDERFKQGNLVLSLRYIGLIVIDKETGEITWSYGKDVFETQHNAKIIPNGNMLVFDNGIKRRRSRVLEIDTSTNKVVWEHPKEDQVQFHSQSMGYADRLPNGNTLYSIPNSGTLVEVSGNNEVTWEYNRNRTGSDALSKLMTNIFDARPYTSIYIGIIKRDHPDRKP